MVSGEATNINVISIYKSLVWSLPGLGPTFLCSHGNHDVIDVVREYSNFETTLQCISQNIDANHWNGHKLHIWFWFNKRYILIMLYFLSIVKYKISNQVLLTNWTFQTITYNRLPWLRITVLTWQIYFSNIMARTCYGSMRRWWYPFSTWPKLRVGVISC